MRSGAKECSPLKKSVREFNVNFSVKLDDVKIHKRAVGATFVVELRGYHSGPGDCASRVCRACIHVLRTLLGVADVIGTIGYREPAMPGRSYQKRLHFSATKGRQREVILGVEIRVRRPFPLATDGWALEFMEGVTAELIAFGCENEELATLRGHSALVAKQENAKPDKPENPGESFECESLLSA